MFLHDLLTFLDYVPIPLLLHILFFRCKKDGTIIHLVRPSNFLFDLLNCSVYSLSQVKIHVEVNNLHYLRFKECVCVVITENNQEVVHEPLLIFDSILHCLQYLDLIDLSIFQYLFVVVVHLDFLLLLLAWIVQSIHYHILHQHKNVLACLLKS